MNIPPASCLLILAGLLHTSAPCVAATKIVGGTATTGHHAVALVMDYASGGYEVRCTATLVGLHWLITTSHCAPLADLVVFGADITAPLSTLEFFEVKERILHPDYAQGNENDVALLRIQGTPNTRPLELDLRTISAADVGLRGTIVGWGTDDAGNADNAGVKRQAATSLTHVEPHHVFAFRSTPNICFGDSGGPFLVNGRMLAMSQFGDGACAEFSGFLRLDVVAAFLLAAAPLCTVENPCVRIFAGNFEE